MSSQDLRTLLLFGFVLLVLPLLMSIILAVGSGPEMLFIYPLWLAALALVWFLNASLKGRLVAIQRAAATTWLVVRRVASFALAAILLTVGVVLVSASVRASLTWQPLLVAMFCFLLAAFCGWIGVFGQGPRRYELQDDIEQHQENKKRFQWRW